MLTSVITNVNAQVLAANALTLTTATLKNLTSFALNPGKWLLSGTINLALAGGTVTSALAGFNTVNNSLPAIDSGLTSDYVGVTTASINYSLVLNPYVIDIGGQGATIYVNTTVTFSAGGVAACCNVNATLINP